MNIFSGLLDFNSFESFSGLSRSQKEMSKGISLTIGFVLVKVRLLGRLDAEKPCLRGPVSGQAILRKCETHKGDSKISL